MYPEQNPQNQPSPPPAPVPPSQPTDYLNQISQKPPKPGLFQMDKKMLIIGGLVLVIIIVAIVAVIANSGRGMPNAELLGARMSGLSTLVKYGNSTDITDSTVRQMVAEVSLLQASEKNQLAGVFGASFSNPSEEVRLQESVSKITAGLDEAKAIGSINSMFKEALIGKIKSVVNLLASILPDVTSQANRDVIQDSIINYSVIIERFSK